ncbi:MAG TPA: MFS transporter, partial [Arenibaculum sp.]|nr:MFS transporter [Arenibaculum sp.]
YLATPRLRGLLALNVAVAAAGAMVIVNSVVIVRVGLGRPDGDVAVALACHGFGSMLAALLLPRVLARVPERTAMIPAALVLGLGLLLIAAGGLVPGDTGQGRWPALLGIWFLLGLAYSSIVTPVGRLLRRSAHPEDRPALFAAQFALSHACWLVTYPLAGWAGAELGMTATASILGALALGGTAAAAVLWPAGDPSVLDHVHADLPPDHPHVRGAEPVAGGWRHRHAFVIDRHHPLWPEPGG